ncbi:DUF2785 domain-containing protein [Streptomyces sp. IBSBF 2390]|uniref:DUF2785 domain-containing protein n=1 Tax=Streptomyces sp. IBSBF 2390 TaxID=2903533 RepID=UPI002FDC2AA5
MSADFVDWPSIATDDFPFPQAVPTTRLADELSVMLLSSDPEIRDDYAYTAAARWIREGHLDDVLDSLGDTAASRFIHPEVQARTFAPLILCCVLTRGHTVPGLVPKQAAERWYAEFLAWYPGEQDTRGWDDSMGWLHAVAHGADAAAAFAKALPDRRTELLELCARRMTAAQSGYRYAQLEDARLARALLRILQAPGLDLEQATGWLTVIAQALDGGGPGPVPVWAFNTFATLQSLHLHLARGLVDEDIPPHAEAVAAHTADILRLPYYWLA